MFDSTLDQDQHGGWGEMTAVRGLLAEQGVLSGSTARELASWPSGVCRPLLAKLRLLDCFPTSSGERAAVQPCCASMPSQGFGLSSKERILCISLGTIHACQTMASGRLPSMSGVMGPYFILGSIAHPGRGGPGDIFSSYGQADYISRAGPRTSALE